MKNPNEEARMILLHVNLIKNFVEKTTWYHEFQLSITIYIGIK